MTENVKLKILAERGTELVPIGKGFLNNKGIDGSFWALPLPNREGRYLFQVHDDHGPLQFAAGLKLKMIQPRKFQDGRGGEGTQWIHIGRAGMGAAGLMGEFILLPLGNTAEGTVRFVMREEDGRPAQPQGGYQGQQGAAERVRTGGFGMAPVTGAQGAQGGFSGRHRDGLSPQATFGGAAAQGPAVPPDDVDDIPF